MTELLIIFIALSIINVVFSTVRSIVTVKGNKYVASLLSGGYFAFYNIMLIYTVMEFPMWQKCVITFGCNVIGVYIVKLIEEKMRKDRLWKIEATFNNNFCAEIDKAFSEKDIPHSYIPKVGKHCIFNLYCETQKESAIVKEIINEWNGKYFASETKIL